MPHHAEQINPARMEGKKLWIQVQSSWVLWDTGAPHYNVEPFLDTLPDVAGLTDSYQAPAF